ncbi:hypothetical protein [Aliiglaciecola sp. M165]|uniref:hypothetical protein n=1 Tax=Aliiglaciecola sp. M165 TaxID=2593649 RepID=UPI00163D9FBE|nr:hypothetical protein [Aliiglaciecola sp. M165]
MSNIITGLFNNASDATSAISVLEFKGISPNDISLIANDKMKKVIFAMLATINVNLLEG